jgi:prolyl oligopeptidase
MPETLTPPEQFHRLIQDEWEFRLREDPLFATRAGDHRYDDRLPSLAEAAFQRRAETLRGFLDRLGAIERAALDPPARVNYDFFERELRIQLEELEFKSHLIPLTKMNGVAVYFPDIVDLMPFRAAADYLAYLRRLEAFPAMIEALIALMRAGAAGGYLPARTALAGVLEGCRLHAAAGETPEAVESSAFFGPFRALPETLPAGERDRLLAAGRAAVAGPLASGYRRLADFLEREYLPQTSADLATLRMPDSKAYYQFCLRRFTSLDLTPRQVHETGLAEVARIRGEMEALIRSVGFDGSLRAFSDSLRSDPRFFVETPAALMKEVAWLMKRIEGQLPVLFKTLPRTPFGMKEIPDFLAPTSTSAYYFLPAGDGTTAGFYYVNTYDLKSRPLYEYEALSLHEAVPGHHLQLALQLEMQDVPEFRKWGETTAFIEGWALYAERLGLEMGFFRDPYTNFGRLVYEMWRAARLVVDTGLHAFDWTRQQAIDYLAENTALSLLNIANEVDRYIAWPGQAVAYKIGELEIRQLRGEAEAALGPRFDVRVFHDVLLRSGGIPLSVLRANVAEWIEENQ